MARFSNSQSEFVEPRWTKSMLGGIEQYWTFERVCDIVTQRY